MENTAVVINRECECGGERRVAECDAHGSFSSNFQELVGSKINYKT